MRQLLGQLGELWCTTMHTSVMWPFRGHYRCGICHREYAVSFEKVAPAILSPAVVARQSTNPYRTWKISAIRAR